MKKSQKQEKNAFIEAHTATKRVWVMVLFIFLTLFLFGSVSAAEWDNVKSYDEGTKTIRIENAFGLPLIGDTIAEIRLETPIKNRVGLGYQKVAEMQFVAYDDFKEWLSTMELYDVNNDMNSIERDLDFKYKIMKDRVVNDYNIVCSDLTLNGTQTNCNEIVIGNHTEKIEEWEDINEYVFVSGDIINIGIFTDVKVGDKIEWIPTFYGKRIIEWAEWTADLNVGLVAYYDFNDIAVAQDLTGNGNNGTNNGATNTSGMLGSAYNFASNDYVVLPDMTSDFTTDATLNAWMKMTVIADHPWDFGNSSAELEDSWHNPSGTIYTEVWRDDRIQMTGVPGFNTNWHMITIIQSPGADGWGFWQDGINYHNATGENIVNIKTSGLSWQVGRARQNPGVWQYFDGKFDEIGIWNRSLTQAEVTQLYNGGAGLNYGVPSSLALDLLSPDDAVAIPTTSNNFLINITDLGGGVNNVSILINGTINQTNSSGMDGLYNFSVNDLLEGFHNWSAEAYDGSDSLVESSIRTFTIDLTSPSFNITLPLNTTYTDNYSISPTINISLNWTVSDTNLDSCWYYNTTENVSITCGNNATIILPYGGYTFIVYANDSAGNENSSNITATWAYKLLQNSITYNADAFELSNEEFKINVSSTGEQTVASNLVYNGTSYSSNKAGDNILMEFSRTIPLYTAGNNSFYWSFGYGSEIINSSTYFQNISETNLANCTSGTKYFNLLLKDEKTMEFLNSSDNISIETVFLYYINDISVNKTFVNSFNQNNVSFCLDPPIENVKVFGEISYDDDLHVKERHFILFENFTNSTTINISLYDLATSESTSFLVFTETEGAPYPDVYMKLKRQYLNLNDFVVVEMAKADSFGQTVLHFVTEDEIYKIDFYDEDGNLVLTTEPFQAVCIDNVCSMSFKVDPEGGIISPFQGISPDGNLVFTLSLVGNDTAVLLTYVSTNGSAYNLQMKTAGFSIVNDTVLVCTETQTNTISGSMSCNISSYPFTTYVTELWVDDVLNDIQYSSVTNDAWKDFGNEGIIYTILIIMALTLLLIYTPELCVLGSIAGVLISAKFGFIPMTYVSGMYLVVAGIIIIFKMRKN